MSHPLRWYVPDVCACGADLSILVWENFCFIVVIKRNEAEQEIRYIQVQRREAGQKQLPRNGVSVWRWEKIRIILTGLLGKESIAKTSA